MRKETCSREAAGEPLFVSIFASRSCEARAKLRRWLYQQALNVSLSNRNLPPSMMSSLLTSSRDPPTTDNSASQKTHHPFTGQHVGRSLAPLQCASIPLTTGPCQNQLLRQGASIPANARIDQIIMSGRPPPEAANNLYHLFLYIIPKIALERKPAKALAISKIMVRG